MRCRASTIPKVLRNAPAFCAFFLAAAFSACAIRAESTPPQLTLDDVNVKQDGEVKFATLYLGAENRTDFPTPRFLLGQTDDHAYRLYLDVDSIQQLRFNSFNFSAYLADAKLGTTAAHKYQITGNPTGTFRDAPVKVSFHVKNGATVATGSIDMPIYNAKKTDLLAPDEQKEPEYVSVSGTTPIQVHLANAPDSLSIAVTDMSVSESCPKCWKRISSSLNDKNPLRIESGAKSNLPIELIPNSIPALLQGALVIKPDLPHDTVFLTVTYHTDPGGADRKQTIPVKIRFGPGLIGLTLALLAGVALGLSARYLLTGQLGKQNERGLHAILSAIVFGLIAEVIGMMMTSYGNSKLVIFDLDIDPRQLFPAFILAVLVSGGSAVVAWMKGLFGKAS